MIRAAFNRWNTKPAAPWQFWLPQSGVVGGVIFGTIAITALLLLTGCTFVPAATVRQTCDLLDTALDEAEMAEAWYIEAGLVLRACGARDAIERAEHKACYARRFNDNSVVCP